MLARNFFIATISAAAIFAAGLAIGMINGSHDVDVKALNRNFTRSLTPAPQNLTRDFTFVNSIWDRGTTNNDRSNNASTQDGRSSQMRSGFGNNK